MPRSHSIDSVNGGAPLRAAAGILFLLAGTGFSKNLFELVEDHRCGFCSGLREQPSSCETVARVGPIEARQQPAGHVKMGVPGRVKDLLSAFEARHQSSR